MGHVNSGPAADRTGLAYGQAADAQGRSEGAAPNGCGVTRRGALLGGMAGMLTVTISDRAHAAASTMRCDMQLGWIGGGNQLGEAVAQQLGYFAQEGLDFRVQAGGPNNDGIAIVASGRYAVGQVSSSPSLMLAASQGLPVRCFAVSAQKHPYAFFSLPKNPVRTPSDFRGKKVGIQATGVILLRALLAKNGIDPKEVQVVTIGSDMMPLMTGQVDVVTGWLTNTTALKVLGPDRIALRLWDTGVHLYANPYYATAETIRGNRDLLARFIRAAARGWAYAYQNRDKAIGLLLKEFPNLVAADEREAADIMLSYAFDESTRADGYGTMDPQTWQDQITLWSQLGQFSRRTPKLEEVMTMDILEVTRDSLPKLG
jgi:NitT/TauT family transport system substrate-binding protein